MIPAMMLVLFAVVQFALWAHAAQVVQLAASDGNRAARVMGGGAAAGRSKAMAVLSGSGSAVTSASVVVSLRTTDVVQTTVSGWAVSVVPWLRLPVSATQVGTIQKFRMSG